MVRSFAFLSLFKCHILITYFRLLEEHDSKCVVLVLFSVPSRCAWSVGKSWHSRCISVHWRQSTSQIMVWYHSRELFFFMSTPIRYAVLCQTFCDYITILWRTLSINNKTQIKTLTIWIVDPLKRHLACLSTKCGNLFEAAISISNSVACPDLHLCRSLYDRQLLLLSGWSVLFVLYHVCFLLQSQTVSEEVQDISLECFKWILELAG